MRNTYRILVGIHERKKSRGRPKQIREDKSKVKAKLYLCLTKHHAMKTYWGMEVQRHRFLTSELGGGEWSASRTGRFTSEERAPPPGTN
jgi:hypothetical protein